MTIHTDLEQAFHGADVIILLDESDDTEEKRQAKAVSARYREYGRLIDARASREVKVLVSGDSLVNMRCSLLVDSARTIDSCRFVAVATQLENEARAVIARKVNVRTSGKPRGTPTGELSTYDEPFPLLL